MGRYDGCIGKNRAASMPSDNAAAPLCMTDQSPRRALTQAFYLHPNYGTRVGNKEFDAAWEWLLREEGEGRSVKDSRIGQCAAKADAILRWVDAAGLEVVRKK